MLWDFKTKIPDFPFTIIQPIAWGDMDALGHVNNVVYARYFETARARFFTDQALWDEPNRPQGEGVILVRQELIYRAQVRFPATLRIHVGILEIFSRAFRMGCKMYKENELCCEGVADLLWIDFTTQKTLRIPDHIRRLAFKKT
ncbi:MAG: acyl-CoA thioesterase [Leptospiraceae bacterium]|nr:acyl-CoA thioesterase [Leptospiraceae bacterium]MDW8306123.1 thioesterase family protein [Leptospiraceae bacterium]